MRYFGNLNWLRSAIYFTRRENRPLFFPEREAFVSKLYSIFISATKYNAALPLNFIFHHDFHSRKTTSLGFFMRITDISFFKFINPKRNDMNMPRATHSIFRHIKFGGNLNSTSMNPVSTNIPMVGLLLTYRNAPFRFIMSKNANFTLSVAGQKLPECCGSQFLQPAVGVLKTHLEHPAVVIFSTDLFNSWLHFSRSSGVIFFKSSAKI